MRKSIMKQAKKPRHPLSYLLPIPIMLGLDYLLIMASMWLDVYLYRPVPERPGHPMPVVSLIVMLLLALITLIVIFIAVFRCIRSAIRQSRAKNEAVQERSVYEENRQLREELRQLREGKQE